MKTLWKTATLVVALLLSISIYSCGDDDEEAIGSVDGLVGIWEGVTEDEWVVEDGKRDETTGSDISDVRYELKSDMTFNYLKKYNGTWRVSETGKWEFSKNTVKLIYYYPYDGGYDEEDPDIWKILEFSETTMIWEFYAKEPGLELYAKQILRKVS